MSKIVCLGVDPGIANTGIAVVESAGHKYHLLFSCLVKTSPKDCTGERLSIICGAVKGIIADYSPQGLAVESVYHNRNVSSSISTGKVIGSCELLAFNAGIPCELLTPQEVKKASGFGGSADKKMLLCVASRLFRSEDNISPYSGCRDFRDSGVPTASVVQVKCLEAIRFFGNMELVECPNVF